MDGCATSVSSHSSSSSPSSFTSHLYQAWKYKCTSSWPPVPYHPANNLFWKTIPTGYTTRTRHISSLLRAAPFRIWQAIFHAIALPQAARTISYSAFRASTSHIATARPTQIRTRRSSHCYTPLSQTSFNADSPNYGQSATLSTQAQRLQIDPEARLARRAPAQRARHHPTEADPLLLPPLQTREQTATMTSLTSSPPRPAAVPQRPDQQPRHLSSRPSQDYKTKI